MGVILASASPRRQELLKMIVSDFSICPAKMEEIVPAGLEVKECPVYLATQKAACIAQKYPHDLVIGCDTGVILENEMLGKPVDVADARRMLQALSGNIHQVITGCCLIYQGKSHAFSETTQVEFYPLSEEEIDTYLATGEYFDKAGSYAIQGEGRALVKNISGDFYNVVGLPVERLRREMEYFSK